MKLKKHLLCVLMCVVMLFVMLPTAAFASSVGVIIDTFELSVTLPVSGEHPNDSAIAQSEDGHEITVSSIKWYIFDAESYKMKELEPRDTFVAGKLYKVEAILTPDEDCSFAVDVKGTVNGEEALCVVGGNGEVTVSGSFSARQNSYAIEIIPEGTEFFTRSPLPKRAGASTYFYEDFANTDTVTILGKGGLYNAKKTDRNELPWYLYRQLIRGVVIGWGITNITDKAFYRVYDHLNNVTLPKTVTGIGESAFDGCVMLSSIELPVSLETIGSEAFAHSGLRYIVLPQRLEKVGKSAFQGCTNLIEITIPSAKMSIGEKAFADCTKLTAVNFYGTEKEWEALKKRDVFEGVDMEKVCVNILEPHVHRYKEMVIAEATCKKKGKATYTCDCGDSYTKTLDKTPHIGDAQNAKVVKATVAAEGYTEYVCTVCGETVKGDVTPKLNFPAPELTGVAAEKGKKITVKWKKSALAGGYQVELSTSKAFDSGVTTKNVGGDASSATFSDLSKDKTYYARVCCTAKDSGGKTVNSGWSGVMSAKAKK